MSPGNPPSLAVRFALLAAAAVAAGGCDRGPTNLVATVSSVRIQSGDKQAGQTDSWLEHPLQVFVTDGSGRGVPNVWVHWQIPGGAGDVAREPGKPLAEPYTMTNSSGIAGAFIRFTAAGTVTVRASLRQAEAAPATFSAAIAQRTHVLIVFGPDHDCMPSDPSGFYVDGKAASAVSVQVGATVEWRYWPGIHPSCRARIVSHAEPPGGERFDSGELSPGQSFRWVPEVAGTWHYSDTISGGGSTLTVRPRP